MGTAVKRNAKGPRRKCLGPFFLPCVLELNSEQ